MLVPIQPSGSKTPLFFVHGMYGIMFLGSIFARALGPDQPFYVINANGIDGQQPVIDTMRDMVSAYVEEIERARPTGAIRVGGMCTGCFIAVEIVRNLEQKGRKVGPVILADPPLVPLRDDNRNYDHRQPQIVQQLYRQARRTLLEHASQPYNDTPFDPGDPNQTHAATLAGVGSLIASLRHIPTPFSRPAGLIISAERAAGFFHPQMPWHKLLPGPRTAHVLPWRHSEMFREGRDSVGRLLKLMLEDEAAILETLAERRAERTVA